MKEHIKTDEHIQDVWINVFVIATFLKSLKITMALRQREA